MPRIAPQAHYTTLLRLKQYFPFSLIDAMGTLEECRAQIARELRYQSSLDLDEATYAAIRHLPLAKDLVRASRQQLVAHLDGYAKRHKELFERVRWPRPAVSLLPPHFGPTKAASLQYQEPCLLPRTSSERPGSTCWLKHFACQAP